MLLEREMNYYNIANYISVNINVPDVSDQKLNSSTDPHDIIQVCSFLRNEVRKIVDTLTS